MFSVTFILGIWEEGAEGDSGFSFRTRSRDNIQAFLLSFELPQIKPAWFPLLEEQDIAHEFWTLVTYYILLLIAQKPCEIHSFFQVILHNLIAFIISLGTGEASTKWVWERWLVEKITKTWEETESWDSKVRFMKWSAYKRVRKFESDRT